MSDLHTLGAIDFLPDNLQEGNDLYPWLAGLIDWALPPPADLEDFPIDDLLTRLGVQYDSTEGVNAYYNKFIKTVIGTRPAMEFAFQLIGTEARIIEWFENEVPAPEFKFIIEFDVYPGLLDFNALIDLIFLLKNERSWPTVIRMAECAENLILDYGHLDHEHLSASEGYMTEMGIMLCLFQRFNGSVVQPQTEVNSLITHFYTYWYEHQVALRWDYDNFDEPWNEAWSNIAVSRGTITSLHIRHDFASEYCAVPDDLVNHGYCLASYVTSQPYHTATYECQIVPSDYGTLSGGEGFIGAYRDLETDFDLDHDEHLLSGVRMLVTPITIFEWILHGVQDLRQTENFLTVLPKRQMQVEYSAYLDTWTPEESTLDTPVNLDNPHHWFIQSQGSIWFDQHVTEVHADLTARDWTLYKGSWGEWAWGDNIAQPVARRFNWHAFDAHLFDLYLDVPATAYRADNEVSDFHTVISDQLLADLYLNVARDADLDAPETTFYYQTYFEQEVLELYPEGGFERQPNSTSIFSGLYGQEKDHLYLDLAQVNYLLEPVRGGSKWFVFDSWLQNLFLSIDGTILGAEPERSWAYTSLRASHAFIHYPLRTWFNSTWGNFTWDQPHPQPVLYSTHTTEDV